MATRQNTKNAIPSNALADLNDNTIILDEWTNGSADYTTDRFGNQFKTRKKILADLQIAVEGIQSKSFLPITGGTVTGSTNFSAGVKSKGSDVFTVNGGTVIGKTNFADGLQNGGVGVLKVGDGGLWSTTLPLLTDFKLLTNKTGIYRALGAGTPTPTLNAPPTSGNVRLTVCVRSDGAVSHFIVVENRSDNPKLWIGQYYSGSDGVKWVEGITTANVASHAVGLGINQSWQDMKASRKANTTYTNTTGRPIQVNISVASPDGGWNTSSILIGDVVVANCSRSDKDNNRSTMSAIVPSGSTYILNSSLSIDVWSELR